MSRVLSIQKIDVGSSGFCSIVFASSEFAMQAFRVYAIWFRN